MLLFVLKEAKPWVSAPVLNATVVRECHTTSMLALMCRLANASEAAEREMANPAPGLNEENI